MSEHEGEGLLDSYRCLGNDWLPGAESASAGAGKLPGAAHKGAGGDGDGDDDDDGDGEGLLHRAQRDTEEEMEADSGGSGAYLLSASRVPSNSSDCTDTTSAACSSSSDSSDNDGDDDGYMTYKGGVGTEEPNYLNSQWATADAPGGEVQRPQARRAQPVVPPSSPSSSSTLLPVPPQRAAQAVAKAQHGLRATRSRLSINSLPNLLKEKTDELDLDYREINVKELDLEEKPVGKGAFGTIYKGSWRGAKVAIKKLNVLSMTEKELYEFRHEVTLMKSLCHHPNIVDFIGACTTPPHFCLVSKYYANGSVKDYLDRHKDVPWITIVKFARDAAAGVLHLHCEHVVHRDLAARNALVDDNLNVRVCDFGLARRMTTQAQENNTSTLLPVAYMAPESIRKQEYSIKSDSFSFGVFLWEIVTRQKPYAGKPLLEVAFGVTIEGLRLKIPEHCPDMFRQLMGKCWETNPEDRPDFYELFLTLEEYLEQLEIEDAHQKERQRKMELARRTEVNSGDPVAAASPLTARGRMPIRIRSTPLMGKAALASPFFGVSTHPLDRSADVSGRMVRSETMLLNSKKNTFADSKLDVGGGGGGGGNEGLGASPRERMPRAGSADGVVARSAGTAESDEHACAREPHDEPLQQQIRVKKGLDGRELAQSPAPLRRKVGWADQEGEESMLLHRSSEVLARLAQGHSIDPAHIVDQFPFENGTHSLICKAKLRISDATGQQAGDEKPLTVAVKRLSNFLRSEKGTREDLLLQAELMLAVRDCPNIVRFLGANLAPENEFLVFQWVKHGSLAQLMYGLGRRWKKLRRQKPLLLVRMAHDVAKAMSYLHEKGIVHCNLEPKNILLDSKYRALLCGFSLARFVNRQADGSKAATTELAEPFRQPQSTILFSAPEVWNVHLRPGGLRPDATDAAQREETRVTSGCQDHGYASDVYSFGMMLWTLWHGFSHEELKKRRKLVRRVWAAEQCRREEAEGAAADDEKNDDECGVSDECEEWSSEREAETKEEEDPRHEMATSTQGSSGRSPARGADSTLPRARQRRARPEEQEKGLRDLMLADQMPHDWLNLTEACLAFHPEERPSFDVILPTLKNIWKNWKDALEARGDITQTLAGKAVFPTPTPGDSPFGSALPVRQAVPQVASPDEAEDAADANEDEDEDASSMSRVSSTAFLSAPSSPFDTAFAFSRHQDGDVPSSLRSLHSFSLSPPLPPQLLPGPVSGTMLKRSAQSSPSFSRTAAETRRCTGGGDDDNDRYSLDYTSGRPSTLPDSDGDDRADEVEEEARVAERARLEGEKEEEEEGNQVGDDAIDEGDTLDSYEESSLLSCVPSADLRREL